MIINFFLILSRGQLVTYAHPLAPALTDRVGLDKLLVLFEKTKDITDTFRSCANHTPMCCSGFSKSRRLCFEDQVDI